MIGHDLAVAAPKVASLLALIVIVSVGVVIARHQRRNPIGWLTLAIPVLVIGFQLCQLVSSHNVLRHPWLAVGFEIGTQLLYFRFLFTTPLILLFFPDGRLPSPRWRRVFAAYGVCAVAMIGVVVASVLVPVWGQAHPNIDDHGDTPSPGPLLGTLLTVLVFCCLGLAASWLVARIISYRRSTGAVRQQYRWLALGAVCLLISLIVSFITPAGNSTTANIENLVTALAGIPFPLSIGVAILRYRLYDIDRIISRTLSYALLTAILAGLYVGCIVLSTQLLRFSSVGLAVSTLVAVALLRRCVGGCSES